MSRVFQKLLFDLEICFDFNRTMPTL